MMTIDVGLKNILFFVHKILKNALPMNYETLPNVKEKLLRNLRLFDQSNGRRSLVSRNCL